MPDSLKGVNSRLVKLALSLQQQFLRADTDELTLGLCTVPQLQTMCIYALDAPDKNALVPPAIVLHQVTETLLTQSMTCLSGLVHPLKAHQKA